ncbi:MAG: hypothetical protein JWN56_1255 [Sphingobacteriales bacterium]|nr:hypothetical protein [Sphingobacteriales bacterium]
MKNNKILACSLILLISLGFTITKGYGQRVGGLPTKSISNRLLISNGPEGPIKGGESAVTDMLLLKDGWVYGSTKATWGGVNCHLFRTNSAKIEHVLNITSKFTQQTSITDIAVGKGDVLIGSTSTSNEIFDDKTKKYEGGRLFSFNPATKSLKDFGIIARGQGINCITVDTVREIIYGVTYPAGHLFSYTIKTKALKDYGEIMTPWRVKDFGRVSWRGVPKVLFLDDAGTLYYATYLREPIDLTKEKVPSGASTSRSTLYGGRIYRLVYGTDEPVFTGAIVPTQTGMDSDPIYENGIASVIRAQDGGFWCGTINDGFLFKFYPSTSTVINKGKAFQYWNLKSLAYGGNNNLYMLGGRDEDNSWLLNYNPMVGSINTLGWPENTAQVGVICADKDGRILFAENQRHSFIWIYEDSK